MLSLSALLHTEIPAGLKDCVKSSPPSRGLRDAYTAFKATKRRVLEPIVVTIRLDKSL